MKWTLHVSVLLFIMASIAQGQFNAVEDSTTDTGNVFIYENPKGFGKALDLVNLPQKPIVLFLSVRILFLLKAWRLLLLR